MSKDYYSVLGLEKGASLDEIKKAYRKLALKHHPDQGGDQEKFKEVNEAYQVLSDPQKKAQYDQFGSTGNSFGGGGFQGQGFNNMDFGDLGDIFGSFFGGGFQSAGARRTGPKRGEDIELRMTVDFETAMFGGEKEVRVEYMEECDHCHGSGAEKGAKIVVCDVCKGTGEIREQRQTLLGNMMTSRPCYKCHGKGKVPQEVCSRCHGEKRLKKSKALKVVIPRGIHDGAVLKLSGQGSAGTDGAAAGDVYIQIYVTESKKFVRKGNDIHSEIAVHIVQAVLGDDIEVDTIHGKKSVVLPAGVEDGKKIRLKGYGAYKLNTEEKGDHIVTVRLRVPKRLSKKEKELYMDLAKESDIKITPQKRGLFG